MDKFEEKTLIPDKKTGLYPKEMESYAMKQLDNQRFFADNEFIDKISPLLGVYATSVYMLLRRHANNEQKAWPSQKTIAFKLGTQVKTVRKALKELEQLNVIYIIRVGKRCTNRYILIDRNFWSFIGFESKSYKRRKRYDFALS